VRVTLSGWTQEQIWVTKETVNGFARKEYSDEAAVVTYMVEKIRNSYNKECINGMIDYFNVYYYGQTEWR
jgi:dTDP-4-dehydrorhamnose 3,5-epimerase-like enzyme